jgi:hypothetical protein
MPGIYYYFIYRTVSVSELCGYSTTRRPSDHADRSVDATHTKAYITLSTSVTLTNKIWSRWVTGPFRGILAFGRELIRVPISLQKYRINKVSSGDGKSIQEFKSNTHPMSSKNFPALDHILQPDVDTPPSSG